MFTLGRELDLGTEVVRVSITIHFAGPGPRSFEMISIVIVSFNTRDLSLACLRSIEAYCPEAEVLLVDNASTDNSVASIREQFPQLRLIESDVNLGFAGANNLGIEESTGDYVILLNSDTVIEDDSLSRCAAYLENHPKVGAVSPRLVGIDGNPQRCLYRFPTIRAKLLEMVRQTLPDEPPAGDGWIAGTALMMRRQALLDAGGKLDSHFFMYWEDCDLSMRIKKAGWELVALTDPHIKHYGGASGGGADSNRRSDLHAWYVYGKHRWFQKNRPGFIAFVAWWLDMLEVPRKYIRGLIKPHRRNECSQAKIQAIVLSRMIFGIAPPRPGRKKEGLKLVPASTQERINAQPVA
jgi:hypothetical protein